MLCADGTFLTGKYKGQILTAIGMDADNRLLPVAFAFVEGESTDSWYWFLERVRFAVVQERPNVCLIHDRHAGLLQAIEELKHGSSERHVPPVWSDIQSRWCMRHLGANFFKQFKNKDLMKLFKGLCNQNQQRKFNARWKELDELTAKYTEVTINRENTEETGTRTSLGSIPTDPPNIRRRSGRNTKTFSQWIEHEPKERWSLLYDTHGARYGVMTTNLAEVYNWVLKGCRALPLVAIVEAILNNTCKYFMERYEKASKVMADERLLYAPNMTEEYMTPKIKKAQYHSVRKVGTMEHRYEVYCKARYRRTVSREPVVQECVLQNNGLCTCSCMKPKLLHKPCSHVIAACSKIDFPLSTYMSQYFFKETLLSTWSGEIYGYGIFGQFTMDRGDEYRWGPDLSRLRLKRGRRRSRRIRNDMDESEIGGRRIRCSICNGEGHTFKNCMGLDNQLDRQAGPSGNATDGLQPPPRD